MRPSKIEGPNDFVTKERTLSVYASVISDENRNSLLSKNAPLFRQRLITLPRHIPGDKTLSEFPKRPRLNVTAHSLHQV